jgi:hypothetical protein
MAHRRFWAAAMPLRTARLLFPVPLDRGGAAEDGDAEHNTHLTASMRAIRRFLWASRPIKATLKRAELS